MPVVTKEGTTYDHLKPSKTHLQPPRKIQQPPTATSKTSTTIHKQANTKLTSHLMQERSQYHNMSRITRNKTTIIRTLLSTLSRSQNCKNT